MVVDHLDLRVRYISFGLPERNTSRTRPGAAEPEVYFRIVHVTLDHANGFPAYREQTVEIALGPKGAFENSNIGTLTRRVPADPVVSAVPERARRAKRPKPPRTPPVVETLRKAIEWRCELDAGEIASQADIARRESVTRARVTHILMLLRLAPGIQERVLDMPATSERPAVSERLLRPITLFADTHQQLRAFVELASS